MILYSVTRTFFFQIAIDAVFDGVKWNMGGVPTRGRYPRTRYGLLAAARDNMFPTFDGKFYSEETVEMYIDDHGLEAAIDVLTYFCQLSGTRVSDIIMDA